MKVKEDTQARNKIESILLEEIEKLQMALVHKSESSKCTHVFEQLYDYIRKAQKQVNLDTGTCDFTILQYCLLLALMLCTHLPTSWRKSRRPTAVCWRVHNFTLMVDLMEPINALKSEDCF